MKSYHTGLKTKVPRSTLAWAVRVDARFVKPSTARSGGIGKPWDPTTRPGFRGEGGA